MSEPISTGVVRLLGGALLFLAAAIYAYSSIGGDLAALAYPNMALLVAGGPVAMLASSRAWTRLGNASLGAGVLGFVVGLVHVMENLDKLPTIGAGVAVALLPMLYSFVLAFVMGALGSGERTRLNGKNRPEKAVDLAPYALTATTFLLLLTFAVLYALKR